MCDVIYCPDGRTLTTVAELVAYVGYGPVLAGLPAGEVLQADECLCPLHLGMVLNASGLPWDIDQGGDFVITMAFNAARAAIVSHIGY